MKNGNPLNVDPRLVVTNEDGDVVPPADVVFKRRDLIGNGRELIEDHPGFIVDEAILGEVPEPEASVDGGLFDQEAIGEPTPGLNGESNVLPEVARRAVKRAHEIAENATVTPTTPAVSEAPMYVTRAMHGFKVDANRRANQKRR